MAEVQITKIIMLRGLSTELPRQLDAAEFGFATDQGRLFIGCDPVSGQPQYARTAYPFQNIEVLTENSTEAFAKLHGDRLREGGGLDYYDARLAPDTVKWTAVQVERDGAFYDYRVTNTDSISAFIDYTVSSTLGEPIRMGNMQLNYCDSDETPPTLTDNGSSRRDPSLLDSSNYDPRQVFGRVVFRFLLSGPLNARFLVFQYKNLTSNVLSLRFKSSRPEAVYYESEEPVVIQPPEPPVIIG